MMTWGQFHLKNKTKQKTTTLKTLEDETIYLNLGNNLVPQLGTQCKVDFIALGYI